MRRRGQGDHPDVVVKRHLLTHQAVVEMNEETGDIHVSLSQNLDPFHLELDMLSPPLWPTTDQQDDIERRYQESVTHPLDLDGVDELLGFVANLIRTPDARSFSSQAEPPDDDQVSEVITLRAAPALILRGRPRTPKLAFFNQIADQLQQLETEGGPLPPGLRHLVDPDADPSSVMPADPTGEDPERWGTEDETFLPLPANLEQLRIVGRVETHPFTVVQGPPGTGKTHTIANLLGHLLASGQRVLITAEKDQALQEVRIKLPEEIQQLCVSAVGRSARDRTQLEVAARTLQDRRGAYNADEYAQERTELESQIETLLGNQAELNAELVQARQWETEPQSIGSYEGTPGQIAERLAGERQSFEWLDEFLTDTDQDSPLEFRPLRTPLANSDALEYISYVRDPRLEELADQLTKRLPDGWEDQLQDPDLFDEQVRRVADASAAASEVAALQSDPLYAALQPHTQFHRREVESQAGLIADHLQRRKESASGWIADAHADIVAGRTAQWENRESDIRLLIADAAIHVREVGLLDVEPNDDQPRRFGEPAEQLLKHLKGGGKFRKLFRRPVAVRQAREFLDTVRVEDAAPTSPERIQTFLDWLEAVRFLDAITERWPEGVERRNEDPLTEQLDRHRDHLGFLGALLDERRQRARLHDTLENLGVRQPDFDDPTDVRRYPAVVEALARFEELQKAERPLEKLADDLARESKTADSPGVVDELLSAAQGMDATKYRVAHQALVELAEAHHKSARRAELRAALEAATSGLCTAIEGDVDRDWDRLLGQLSEAHGWCLARVGIRPPYNPATLHRGLDQVREQIKEARGGLIANLAWDRALSRLSQRDLTALGAYVLAVSQLGAGTGKYAAGRRRDVQDCLKECRSGVAAWIMPLHRVFSDMRPEAGIFDIVIVDEASQAGTDASFLHYLAPRVLVIGDDKQVAPEAPGLDISEVHALVRNYLGNVSAWLKRLYRNPGTSFFDQAKLRTTTVTLKEHFRCVPEIIAFSNQHFYEPVGITLVPVRQYGTDRLPPLKHTFVPDGYRNGQRNPPEAQRLVEQLCECVDDPAYTRTGPDGEPELLTFGVISLTDRDQADAIQTMLLERLGESAMRARQIRCGTAADFQGSERDVIFLSMVNAMTGLTSDQSGSVRYQALTGARAERRFNVACSRAKDQMWLFHSLQVSELPNPADLRLRLLSFYENQTTDPLTGQSSLVPEDERVRPFDSVFEQRVYNEIVRRGYRVVPQFKVHGRKIDLAVEGAKSRLAVECDGDFWHGPEDYQRDAERQRDLERVGWRFFRVRESEFNYDRSAALEPLWDLLHAQGIEPAPPQPVSEAEPDPSGLPRPADEAPGTDDETPPVGDLEIDTAEDGDETGPQPEPTPVTPAGSGQAQDKVQPSPTSRIFGHIPGVEVGTIFPDRQALSRSGVHRPTQAGISGSQHDGADSIVVSGGYVDDKDRGDLITYTGQGGNDPNTGRQVADQELTRGNKALAISHDRKLPVRVVRGSRGDRDRSPPTGYRYDGLFLVARCWSETGQDGYRIWRFELRQSADQAEPAPEDAYSRDDQASGASDPLPPEPDPTVSIPIEPARGREEGVGELSVDEIQDRLDEIRVQLTEEDDAATKLELLGERESLQHHLEELRESARGRVKAPGSTFPGAQPGGRRRRYRIRYQTAHVCGQCHLERRAAHFGDPRDPLCPEERRDCPLLELLVEPGGAAAPAGSELSRRPYPVWQPTGSFPATDDEDATIAQRVTRLVEITESEGPIIGKRLYDLYLEASGERSGTSAAQGTAAAVNEGALVDDNPLEDPGQISKTFRLPDQPAVVVRELGPRSLLDVPPRELAEVLDHLMVVGGNEDPTGPALRWYGLDEATPEENAWLQRVFDYLVEPGG